MWTLRWLVCLLVLTVGAPSGAQVAEPLPDPAAFLENLKETLLSDQLLLSQYTYDEEHTGRDVDKKGRTKKAYTSISEVFPSLDPKLHYNRLVSKDGEPVPEKELQEQDRKHVKKARKHLKKLEERGSKKQRRQEEQRQKQEEQEREWVDEAFRALEFEMTGREDIGGRTAIVFRFGPRPDYRVKIKAVRDVQKALGQMWISEEDHQMIRLEFDLMEPISVVGGIVGRIHKGAHFEFQREKVNDEIWLPSESRIRASGRVFLVKRIGFEGTWKYSNHHKYSAESFWKSGPVLEAQDP